MNNLDMTKGFNTYINDFKKNIVDMINQSGLPVGIIYYVVKDLFSDITNAYELTLKNEQETAEQIKITEKEKENKNQPNKIEK